MADLDEPTCAQLRELQGPPAELRAQMLEAIWSQIDGPIGPDDGGSASDAGPAGGAGTSGGAVAKAAWVAKIVGATAGLTAAGLLTLKLAALVFVSVRPEPRPVDASEASQPVDTQADAQAIRAVESGSVPAGDPAIAEPSPPSTNQSARPQPSAVEHEPTSSEPARSERTGSLRAELELLELAEALVSTNPRAALEQLERHRLEFPGGVLEPERDVLRVEVLCSLGRTSDAARVAATLRQDHAGSPQLERVEASCAAEKTRDKDR